MNETQVVTRPPCECFFDGWSQTIRTSCPIHGEGVTQNQGKANRAIILLLEAILNELRRPRQES